jgi:hypothetical protein
MIIRHARRQGTAADTVLCYCYRYLCRYVVMIPFIVVPGTWGTVCSLRHSLGHFHNVTPYHGYDGWGPSSRKMTTTTASRGRTGAVQRATQPTTNRALFLDEEGSGQGTCSSTDESGVTPRHNDDSKGGNFLPHAPPPPCGHEGRKK